MRSAYSEFTKSQAIKCTCSLGAIFYENTSFSVMPNPEICFQ